MPIGNHEIQETAIGCGREANLKYQGVKVKMPKRGKKYIESSSKIESARRYDFNEAIDAAISSSLRNLMKPSMWQCASGLIPGMPIRWFAELSFCPMASERK
jgi:hypothetical protein